MFINVITFLLYLLCKVEVCWDMFSLPNMEFYTWHLSAQSIYVGSFDAKMCHVIISNVNVNVNVFIYSLISPSVQQALHFTPLVLEFSHIQSHFLWGELSICSLLL